MAACADRMYSNTAPSAPAVLRSSSRAERYCASAASNIPVEASLCGAANVPSSRRPKLRSLSIAFAAPRKPSKVKLSCFRYGVATSRYRIASGDHP